MDPQLYSELCCRGVEYYEKMLDEGSGSDEIWYALDTQLTELVPECQLYKDLQAWWQTVKARPPGSDDESRD
jgi:hypothetical protein